MTAAPLSPALPRVTLVRHGETAWTLTAQHTGRTDLPLTEAGERQARALEPRLATLAFDRIYSSPLRRARRTAELAMPQAASAIEEDGDLMEWDYGAYEGRRTVDIQVERPGWRLFRNGCPDGERVEDVGARADRVIERLRSGGGDVLLFGHRDILRILAVRWLGLAPIEGFHFQLATASVSVLGYDHDLGTPVIHTWNSEAPARPA